MNNSPRSQNPFDEQYQGKETSTLDLEQLRQQLADDAKRRALNSTPESMKAADTGVDLSMTLSQRLESISRWIKEKLESLGDMVSAAFESPSGVSHRKDPRNSLGIETLEQKALMASLTGIAAEVSTYDSSSTAQQIDLSSVAALAQFQEHSETLTPSFTVSSEGNRLVLDYHNAPPGLRWDLTNPNSTNGTYTESMIPEGSGKLLMEVASDSTRNATVVITNTNGNTKLGPWVPFQFGNRTIVQPPASTSFTLPSLTREHTVKPTGLPWIATHQNPDEQRLTPAFHLSNDAWKVTVTSENFPEGFSMALMPADNPNGVLTAIPVPQGSGSDTTSYLLSFSRINVCIIETATGTIVSAPIPMAMQNFKITEAPSGTRIELPELAYTLSSTPAPRPTAAPPSLQAVDLASALTISLAQTAPAQSTPTPTVADIDTVFMQGLEEEVLLDDDTIALSRFSSEEPLVSVPAETETRSVAPLTFALADEATIRYTYDNPTDHDLWLVVVPCGGAANGASYIEKHLPPGQGTETFRVPDDPQRRETDIFLFDPLLGKDVSGRGQLDFSGGRVLTPPPATLTTTYSENNPSATLVTTYSESNPAEPEAAPVLTLREQLEQQFETVRVLQERYSFYSDDNMFFSENDPDGKWFSSRVVTRGGTFFTKNGALLFHHGDGTVDHIADIPEAAADDPMLFWNENKRKFVKDLLIATSGEGPIPTFTNQGFTDPQLRTMFENRLQEDVRTGLPISLDARTLAIQRAPNDVTPDADVTPFGTQIVVEAQQALNAEQHRVSLMAKRAFELISREFAGLGRFTVQEVADIGRGLTETELRLIGNYIGSARMTEPQTVIAFVYGRMADYAALQGNLIHRERVQMVEDAMKALHAADAPDPTEPFRGESRLQALNATTLTIAQGITEQYMATIMGPVYVPTGSRLLEANRESLIAGWNAEGLNGELVFALQSAGHGHDDAVALSNSGEYFVVDGELVRRGGVDVVERTDVVFNGEVLHEATSVLVESLSVPPEGRTTPKDIRLEKGGSTEIQFNLTEESMVNFWVDANVMKTLDGKTVTTQQKRSVNLTLVGSGISMPLQSTNAGPSGQAISKMLPAGKYFLRVQDNTQYFSLTGQQWDSLDPHMQVGVNIQKYNSASIQGRISIEGTERAKSVSMRMAAFDPDTQKRVDVDSDKKPLTLSGTKPIILIIHGRGDKEDSGKMEDLTKTLFEFAKKEGKGSQIVTIDWSEAAKDFNNFNPDAWDTSDSRWTKAVGEWVAQQLVRLNSNFNPGVVSEFVHSHGNAVGYYIASTLFEETGEKINLFVGLDPAKNPGFIGGAEEYEATNLSKFAENSVAFDSSWLGSSHFSGTALRSYIIQPESNNVDPNLGLIKKEILQHGASVATVSAMIQEGLANSSILSGRIFSLSDLLVGKQAVNLKENILGGDEQPFGEKVFEGEVVVRTEVRIDKDGEKWLAGTPISFQYKKPDGTAVRESVTGLHLEDSPDAPLLRNHSVQSWVGDINSENIHSFDVTKNGLNRLVFSLPKTETVLLVKIEQIQSPDFLHTMVTPFYASVSDSQKEVSAILPPGQYRLTIRQELPSQSVMISGHASYADMPYTVTLLPS